ncbi:single-stranded DNA-binding protein [Dysgonomonas sp. 521]|uniref:ERF family protein n=1 Tax=Dysgonomonas sp. 521 TaxID=2302932 RepID=UPI0013D5AEE6|nr:ERF family protein [Dysgonomonas sp. 521]NDV93505.1 single-stranded DNA-binding protein [Dysgonomonas sp. 521]
MEELIKIQSRLKAPKNQLNKFGNYNYRSCEDILEAVKPLLEEMQCTLVLSDEVKDVGGRVYIEATAILTNEKGKSAIVKAYAREEETKKGMDAAQITGSASSYARKYALNGLFCIDDSKEIDSEKHENRTPEEVLSDKRKAVYDVMLANNNALNTILKRYDIGVMEDLTNKQIETTYNAWVKSGHIKEKV